MVGTRIHTGFAVVLDLLMLVAVVGVKGFGNIDALMVRYEDIAQNQARGLEVQRDIANMRRNARLCGMAGDSLLRAGLVERRLCAKREAGLPVRK